MSQEPGVIRAWAVQFCSVLLACEAVQKSLLIMFVCDQVEYKFGLSVSIDLRYLSVLAVDTGVFLMRRRST
jgi:hypothetical protein